MSPFRLSILLSILLLGGCANIPDSYAPPAQRGFLAGTDPGQIGSFVDMIDPDADAYIVGDVTDELEAGSWRWTRKRPELRFFLDSIERLNFQADFRVGESTFRDTGPVAVSILINGNLLATVKFDAAAEQHFVKPVPAKFLHAKSVNFAALEIDRLWASKSGASELGFMLARAGFRR